MYVGNKSQSITNGKIDKIGLRNDRTFDKFFHDFLLPILCNFFLNLVHHSK